jgi:hypothetical protein
MDVPKNFVDFTSIIVVAIIVVNVVMLQMLAHAQVLMFA